MFVVHVGQLGHPPTAVLAETMLITPSRLVPRAQNKE